MTSHVFMRDIKDRILAALPVWGNVKRAQKLDEYIKEKKVEKKNKRKNFHLKRWNSAYISARESGSSISKDWQNVPLYSSNHFYYLVEFFILWSMREDKTCFNRWQCEGLGDFKRIIS